MGVAELFQNFCDNLRMKDNTVDNIQSRYHQIIKRINQDFWEYDSNSIHGLYVGSYGRSTEIWTSDIDILVQLPYDVYKQYDSYQNNGQSALIQSVRNSISTTYSQSNIRGDGQVVCVSFSDGIQFEVVPCFINKDGSFTYPDTNNGGSWKITNPRAEIDAMNQLNKKTNKNLKHLCRMVRAWKQNCNVDMPGILIDTLAYNFISKWDYNDKSYLYYDWMSRDFFEYLYQLPNNQNYWLAPGSNRFVWKGGAFQMKAKNAYDYSLKAIESMDSGYEYTAREKWSIIYGSRIN